MRARWLILSATAAVYAVVIAVAVPLLGVMDAANVFMAILLATSAGFCALYGLRSNWRATSAGRAVMALIGCIGTICIIGTLGAYLGDYPGRPIVRLIAFAAVGLTVTNLLLTLVEAQRTPANRRDP